MKKSFNITNYLNDGQGLSKGIIAKNRTQPQDTQNEEEYIMNRKGNRQDVSPRKSSNEFSLMQRTITGETNDITNRRRQNTSNTLRYGQGDTSMLERQSAFSHKLDDTSRPRQQKYLNSGDQALFRATRDARYYERELQVSIGKLKDLKENLEEEISSLQLLLDTTSQHLKNVDKEFDKIKLRILEYTARCLDAGFVLYKNSMTRWSKYEEIEKKGLQVNIEMGQFIQTQQTLLNGKVQQQVGVLQEAGRETQTRIGHYNEMVKEIRKVKEECMNKRPILRQGAIAQFERAAMELSAF